MEKTYVMRTLVAATLQNFFVDVLASPIFASDVGLSQAAVAFNSDHLGAWGAIAGMTGQWAFVGAALGSWFGARGFAYFTIDPRLEKRNNH